MFNPSRVRRGKTRWLIAPQVETGLFGNQMAPIIIQPLITTLPLISWSLISSYIVRASFCRMYTLYNVVASCVHCMKWCKGGGGIV